MDGEGLEALCPKWEDRTQKSLNVCQGNAMCPDKWPWQAPSFAERAERLISCSVFKQRDGDHVFSFTK